MPTSDESYWEMLDQMSADAVRMLESIEPIDLDAFTMSEEDWERFTREACSIDWDAFTFSEEDWARFTISEEDLEKLCGGYPSKPHAPSNTRQSWY